MGWIIVSEPNKGVLAPAPGLSGELVVDEIDVARGETQRLHIEVDLGLHNVVRIKAAYHDHHVIAAPLGIDQCARMRCVMEVQVP